MSNHAGRGRRGRADAEASSSRGPGAGRQGASAYEDDGPLVPADFAAAREFTKYERTRLRRHLAPFHQKELIVDVVHRIKAGKEATVYACTGHPSTGRALVAAKLYRERSMRGSKNASEYEEGRAKLDRDGNAGTPRSRRAGKRGSREPGSRASDTQTSWLMHEFKLLQALHARAGDVPEPIEHSEHAVLMEFVGDGSHAAATLNDVKLEPDEAKLLFDRVIVNVELLLELGWVHGDLSAHNILYQPGRIALIDFPQVVHCRDNPRALAIFERDLERVGQYFETSDWSSNHQELARQLWSKYVLDPVASARGDRVASASSAETSSDLPDPLEPRATRQDS